MRMRIAKLASVFGGGLLLMLTACSAPQQRSSTTPTGPHERSCAATEPNTGADRTAAAIENSNAVIAGSDSRRSLDYYGYSPLGYGYVPFGFGYGYGYYGFGYHRPDGYLGC